MNLLSFALAYAAMIALCLAIPRHHRQLFELAPPPARQRALRLLALVLLMTAAALNVAFSGWAIGLVVSLAQLMCAGLLVGLMLAWRERLLLPIGATLSLVGVVTAFI
ncbi:DUF3325 domain-containing protein [Pseudomonas sp. PS1]|uniref:DUF3325 domain-containing protein n=1 Tax=Stutzerimonas marianensis TaxID=2929513 RepID=A0A9X2AS43_9GAMM|nr:DUF3325 domain-containing protein [Pseudomonas marianensis]MCJ0973265.1 DUF3325 domain-containing protein [Pseudomonas marianensis]